MQLHPVCAKYVIAPKAFHNYRINCECVIIFATVKLSRPTRGVVKKLRYHILTVAKREGGRGAEGLKKIPLITSAMGDIFH